MSISENIKTLKESLPAHVTLVAVSKTKPNDAILEAYKTGQLIFGENKIQEMAKKWEVLPKDIEWHMIGHVQRNKVKYMAEFVTMVHGVDSFKLLKEIDKQAKKHQRKIKCLFQVHIAKEDTKFGLNQEELESILKSEEFIELENIQLVGLMGMATFTNDTDQIREEFTKLKKIFDKTKMSIPEIEILSMGMSGDFQIAIEEGSTMVRIGSSIFGIRNYAK